MQYGFTYRFQTAHGVTLAEARGHVVIEANDSVPHEIGAAPPWRVGEIRVVGTQRDAGGAERSVVCELIPEDRDYDRLLAWLLGHCRHEIDRLWPAHCRRKVDQVARNFAPLLTGTPPVTPVSHRPEGAR